MLHCKKQEVLEQRQDERLTKNPLSETQLTGTITKINNILLKDLLKSNGWLLMRKRYGKEKTKKNRDWNNQYIIKQKWEW